MRQESNGADGGHGLALDLTAEAVVLCAFDGRFRVVELGRARLSGTEFAAEIERLRIETLVRGYGDRPITLWLPEDQILSRRLRLSSRRKKAALAEAMRIVTTETGYKPEELSLTIMAQDADAHIALAALTQTVREARDYARKWGFPASRVSTRIEAAEFGPAGPEFTVPAGQAKTYARRALQAVAAVAITSGAAFGLLKLYESDPIGQAVEVAQRLSPDRDTASVQASAPTPSDTAATASSAVDPHQSTVPLYPLVLPPQGIPGVQDPDRVPAIPVGAVVHLGANVLDRSTDDLRIGPALSARSAAMTPGELSIPSATIDRRIVGDKLLAALGRIRSEAKSMAQSSRQPSLESIDGGDVTSATQQPPPEDEPVNAPSGTASLVPIGATPRGSGALQAEQDDLGASSPGLLASLAPASQEPDRQAAGLLVLPPRPDEHYGRNPGRPEDPTEPSLLAPEAVLNLPLRRPRTEETIGLVGTPEMSDGRVQRRPDVSTQSAEPSSETEGEPTEFAALSAPAPRSRPQRSANPKSAKKAAWSIRSGSAPRSVRTAAAQSGLDLDQTSLIGVIDASSGRQALIRTENGEYRRVARGDDLNGWRVRSIGREAIKLSKQGRNRTLLLVSR